MPLPGCLISLAGVSQTAIHLQAWQAQPHRLFRSPRSPAFKPDQCQVYGVRIRCQQSFHAEAPSSCSYIVPKSKGESASRRSLPEKQSLRTGGCGEPAKRDSEDRHSSEEEKSHKGNGAQHSSEEAPSACGPVSGGRTKELLPTTALLAWDIGSRGRTLPERQSFRTGNCGEPAKQGSEDQRSSEEVSTASVSGGRSKELLLLAALVAWDMGSPQHAQAYGHRRHHRRRDEDVQLAPKQKRQPEQTKIVDFRKDSANRWQLTVDPDELKRRWATSTDAVGSSVGKAFGGVRSEVAAVRGALRGVQTSVAAPAVGGVRPGVSSAHLGILGRAVLVLVLGVAGLLQLWRWVRSPRLGGGRGVVVRDRSLAGREVFIARTPLSTDPLAVPKKNAREQSASRVKSKPEREIEMPSWWPRPQPLPPATPGSLQEVHAQAVLNGMLSRRLVGKDFSHSDILELRRACRGRAVRLAVQTGSTRDSLYRAAVEHALAAVARGATEIGLESPASFLAGFSENVGLEPGKTAAIVKGAVAARTRAALLQAVALLRQQREDEAQGEMRALASIHSMFPPSDDSAEMDMVSHSLGSKLSMEERQSLLVLYDTSGGLATSGIVKQALGFGR